MTYKLRFHEKAWAEWGTLDKTLRDQFRKKLAERLENPRLPSAALKTMRNCYKIKLRKAGYRLVYSVEDNIITVTVIAIGQRDKLKVYAAAEKRLNKEH
jgi:mRNA interferase RelE/StbE